MEKFFYLYRMTSDSGMAPCVYLKNRAKAELLSLTCCKGGAIRNDRDVKSGMRRRIGDCHMGHLDMHEVWIAALYQGNLLYAAKLDDIKTMWSYFSEYTDRMDSIYSSEGPPPASDEATTDSLRRNGFNKWFHADPNLQRKDRLGKYALISRHFVYYGKNSTTSTQKTPQSVLAAFPKNRGCTCITDKSEHYEAVKNFFCTLPLGGVMTEEPHRWIDAKSAGCKECSQP